MKQLSQMKNKSTKAIVLGSVALALGGCTLLFGPNLGPLKSMTVEKSPEQLERGKYLLTNVVPCLICHSERNWNKFSAPVVAGTEGRGGEHFGEADHGLPGDLYAKNITPAALSSWSDAELLRAMTEGVSKDGHALFPLMPYLNFRHLTEADAKSIIAYLRTLKPIENAVPARKLNFPVNFIVNTMPEAAQLPASVNKSDSVEYGKYLATIASCADCHTPIGSRGKRIEELTFAGGMEFGLPTGTVRSKNITPDTQTGIGSWTKEAFIERFRSQADASKVATVGPNEFNTAMPWTFYGNMDTADLSAIYDFLRTVKPVNHSVELFTAKQ